MKPTKLFRGLSCRNWIDKTTASKSVSAKAFLRKERDVDGLSVFDEAQCCHKLDIYGIALIETSKVEALANPLDGSNLHVRFNDPEDTHHLVIENVPFHHLHEYEAEMLAGHLARRAALFWEKTKTSS